MKSNALKMVLGLAAMAVVLVGLESQANAFGHRGGLPVIGAEADESCRCFADALGGRVGRAVVHNDDIVDSGMSFENPDNTRHRVGLVERGNDG